MREIKFRAWDTIEKKIRDEALMIGDIGLGSGSVIASEEVQTNNSLIWMQYTGLKDKNGVEIYEGDIVYNKLCSKLLDGEEAGKRVVVFIDGGWRTMDLSDFVELKDTGECDNIGIGMSGAYSCTYHKVIGNIYENPELLKLC